MHLLMTAMTPALRYELRHAANVILDALTGTHPANPAALDSAHTTLTQRRDDTTGHTRQTIDHYLHHDTWRRGPHVLHQAALQLAAALDVPPRTEPPATRWVQPSLFDPTD
jgi:hypothetical protein